MIELIIVFPRTGNEQEEEDGGVRGLVKVERDHRRVGTVKIVPKAMPIAQDRSIYTMKRQPPTHLEPSELGTKQ